jgi:predicted transcriptional regulator
MPDTTPPPDVIEDEAERLAIEKARAEVAAGKTVPHEQVREWLLKLRNGETPPPWT